MRRRLIVPNVVAVALALSAIATERVHNQVREDVSEGKGIAEHPSRHVTSVWIERITIPWAPTLEAQVIANGIKASAVTLRQIIVDAYGVEPMAAPHGPDWLDTERFDLLISTTETPRPDDMADLLRAILTSHFKLVTHQESDAENRTSSRVLVIDHAKKPW